jgi:hypothetical protein
MLVHSDSRRARWRAVAALAAAPLALGALAVPSASAAPPAGQLYGQTDPTYDGVYRQSLAILGLNAAGIEPADAAVEWLLDQQCADGGFSSYNADTSVDCPPFDGDSYTGGVDSNATAVAAQALLAVGEDDAAEAAVEALVESQNANGGWEYTIDPANTSSDPNSTALAWMALTAAAVEPTIDPLPYFTDLQVGRTLVADFPEDEGGIASPYSAGAPDVLATVQSIPAILGTDLVEVTTPDPWAADAETHGGVPAATADGIAGWATSWLAAQVDADEVPGSYLPWAILSFAADATAKDQADDAYTAVRAATLDIGRNPGALGQAALAAKALGKSSDLNRYANLIAATLTPAAVVPPVTPPVVTPDRTAPAVSMVRPAQPKKVSSWRTLRGAAADAGSGVAKVEVAAVEKRGTKWFAYTGKKRWVKRPTLAKANARARTIAVSPKASGAWSLKLTGLTTGKLRVSVSAVDRAANASSITVTVAKLKK